MPSSPYHNRGRLALLAIVVSLLIAVQMSAQFASSRTGASSSDKVNGPNSPAGTAGAKRPRAKRPGAPRKSAQITPASIDVVTNGNDSGAGSLRDVIAAAAAGDTINFAPGVTTVTLTSFELDIFQDLTIDGGSTGVTVARSGSKNLTIFAIEAGTVALTNLTITNGNGLVEAGGVFNGGTLTMTNCTVTGNKAEQAGGIQNIGTITIIDCTISNNTATEDVGGGLLTFGPVTITGSTISNNTSASFGGGISVNFGDGPNGSLSMTNCTVYGNTAVLSGGAVYLDTATDAPFVNCTIANNSSGIDITSTNCTLTNCIVAGNGGADISGPPNSGSSFNIFGQSSVDNLPNGVSGNQLGVTDTGLTPLGNFGGPTETCALSAGSPALNTGTSTGAPATDQRGVSRPQGLGFDIGAFEASIIVDPATIPSATLNSAYVGVTFTAAGGVDPLTFSLTGTLPNGMTFDPATATLSGTPTQLGSFPITVVATDSTGISGASAYIFTDSDCPVIVMSPTSLPAGIPGSAYSASFSAAGGAGTITFTESGALPPGMTFSGGMLSGTPTQGGTFPFTVTATDSKGCIGIQGYTLVINCSAIGINPTSLPAGVAGSPYASTTFTTTAGVAPISFSETGMLPSGMTLTTAGVLSGTPAKTGNFPITVTATDANGCTESMNYTLIINCPTIGINPSSLQAGLAGNPYTSTTLTTTAGITPISFSESGPLPTGMTLSSAGVLSGTPTQHGSFPITITATDGNGCTGSMNYTLTINCPIIGLNPSSLQAGFAGSPYTSTTFTTTGGVTPISYSETGPLPTGMTLSSGGVLSGTPTQHGSFPITVTATDASGCTGSQNYTLTINCATIGLNPSGLQPGFAGSLYTSTTLSTTAGIAPISYSETGPLPTGMTLSSGGVLSGTPTQHGSFPITVTATDAIGCTGSMNYTLTVNCPTIGLNPSSLQPGFAGSPYTSTTLSTTAGIAPISYSETGSLPTGMTLSTAGVLSGTPTKTGSFPITVTATDAIGCTGSMNYNLTVNCLTIGLNPSRLQAGFVGSPYTSTTLSTTAGIAPISFSETGPLPTGMTLSSAGVLSGTPTQPGSFPITVTATDANGCTGSMNYTLTINCPTIGLNPSSLQPGFAGSLYTSTTLSTTAGIAPISFSETGPLPTGMTLSSAGVLSGTPTQHGSFPITITATDANGCTGSMNYTLTINCATIGVNPSNIFPGTEGGFYSPITFTSFGGVGTVTYSETGGLPTGMSFSSGTLSGTPTQRGSFPITVTATDSAGCTGSQNYTLTINCATIIVTPSTINAAKAGSFYGPVTFSNAFGTAVTFSETGALPNGVTLTSAGVLSGTPTQTGSFPFTITATDSFGCTGSQALTLVVNCSTISVTPTSLPSGSVDSPYSPVMFSQTGGEGSVTFSETGALPSGMTFSSVAGLQGTPTESGSFPITVTATDSNGCTGSVNLTLTINCDAIVVTPYSLTTATLGVPYPSTTFTQTGGVGTVTFYETGALPTGMTFSGGVLSGTPSESGAFPITVTATDSNGCTGSRNYIIAVACADVALSINPEVLPEGLISQAYPSTTFTASGGSGSFTFTEAGLLPAGMSFNNGTLSGTPSQSGVFPITVAATDSNHCATAANYLLVIACLDETLTVFPGTLANGTTGSAYSPVTFSGSGGVLPFTLYFAGSLPQGMTFSEGVLSGTPTQSGTFQFTVAVTDAFGCAGGRNYSLTVGCPAISVSPSTLVSGTSGVAYSPVTFTSTGGATPVTLSETGALPTGMTFSAGVLSGTPTQSGSFPIVVTATDANGCTGSQNYTLTINCPGITVSPSTVPSGTAGALYSSISFSSTGGVGTVTFSETGALPTGMTFSGGVLSGTPTKTGSFPISVTATDSNGCTGSQNYTLTIGCPTISVNPASLSSGAVGAVYGPVTFTQSGGAGSVTFSETGTLPTGITFSGGILSGTPTQTGSFPITVTATDANGCTGSRSVTLTVNCGTITVGPASLPAGKAGALYSSTTFTSTGGVGTVTFSETGSLPSGMTFSAGVLSGTPTKTGSFPITVTATDSNGCTGSQNYTLTIACPTITVNPSSLSSGAVGAVYGPVTFTQTGGVGTVTFSETGSLPSGTTFSAGVLSGTPTKTGSFPITVTATDSNGCTGSQNYTLTVGCPTITVNPSSLSSGAVGAVYGPVTFTQTGGVGAVTFSETGALPTGITFSAGVLSGTPTQTGSFPITVTATDANGCTGSRSVTLTVNCGTITVGPASLPAGKAGALYSSTTFTSTGGVGTVTFSETGSLPSGMTFSAGVLSGTPTKTGSFPITVTATDANGCTGSQNYTLTIGCPTITVNPASLGSGAVGAVYGSITFTQTGGVGTVTFSETGALPSGMTFSSGALSGTPTQTGSFPITVTATDSNGCTGSQAYTLTIGCSTISVNPASLAAGNAGVAYTPVTFTQTGGVGTVTFSETGALPSGMTFSSGALSGTPTQTGSFPITVTATDSNGCTGSRAYTFNVGCSTITVGPGTIPAGVSGTSYSPVTFTQTGGVGDVTFSESGTLPTGMTFSGGVLSGTPTQNGTFPITIAATDSNGCTGSANYSLSIGCSQITVGPDSIPTAVSGTAYATTTFTQTGGAGTVTFSETGALPSGMTFSDGVLSGTPTVTGAFPITVTATDSGGCTGSRQYVIAVSCPAVNISVAPGFIPAGTNGQAYASTTFTASGGTGSYGFIEAGALPSGITFANGVLSGTPTQSGLFPITVAATDGSGCAAATTYLLAVACPGTTISVAPGSIATATEGAAIAPVTFAATGGAGSYTFKLAGSLPTGLSVSETTLSGTPTQPGTFHFTVGAVDANGCAGVTQYSLTVSCPAISVGPATIPSGAVGSAYISATFTSSGGAGTVAFSESGTLPPGMTFSNGVLSGTPTSSGSFPITVKATDQNGCTGSMNYTLSISCPAITVSPSSVGSGSAGAAYSPATFTQAGGVGSMTFSESGALPKGMTFASGVLSGTPTQTGTFPITVTATDSNGCTGQRNYALVINCPVITVNVGTMTQAVEFAAYTPVQFTQTGGIGSVTFSTSSTLPTGLTLSSSGLLSGTPTQAGTFSITVIATDSTGCTGSKTVTLSVTALNKCLKDDQSGDYVQFSSTTGAYIFTHCGASGFTLSGTATITTKSGLLVLTDVESGWSVTISYSPNQLTGTATIDIKLASGITETFTISDTNPHPVCVCGS